MPGRGDLVMPGRGDLVMPGRGDLVMPGRGDLVMPGRGEKWPVVPSLEFEPSQEYGVSGIGPQ